MPAEALAVLALSGAPRPTFHEFVLVRPDADGHLHVVARCHAATMDDAVALFPKHPADWFVSSMLALRVTGPMPVTDRCACGRALERSFRHRGGSTVCEACLAKRKREKRRGAA